MNTSIDMTNTDFLLYWAKFCSSKQNAITPLDRIMLVKNSLFKDKKAVNDAIYRLHIDEKIVKYGDDWYITDYGDAYLEAVLENINKKTNANAPAKGPKKDEWTDADFGITPLVREYIDGLDAKNIKLIDENAKLKAENDKLLKENCILVKRIGELKAQINELQNANECLKAAYENCVKAFNILANI